ARRGQRRSRGEVLRQRTREGLEKRDEVAHVRVGERPPELHARHHAHRLGERRDGAVVKVGRRQATLRSGGTLKTYRSAGSPVTSKRPRSTARLLVAAQYSSRIPNFWYIVPPTPAPLWHAAHPIRMKVARPARAGAGMAASSPARKRSKGAGVIRVRT